MDELALLGRFLPTLHSGPDTVVGPGDDCAAVDCGGSRLLLAAADHLIADIHYLRQDTDPSLAGAKLFNRNASDIAAMGGTPRWALLTLAANGCPEDELLAFAQGTAQAAEKCGAFLIGGDIAALPEPGLSASLTILGMVKKEEILCRKGAKAGDLLCVTGVIGNAYHSGHHLTFTPRLKEGRFLAENHLASAMLDISDGLLLDAARLAEMSQVQLILDPAKVPLRAGAGLPEALSDGEDYELLFTVPQEQLGKLSGSMDFTVIGEVRPGEPGVFGPDGENLLTGKTGYEHGKL